MDNLMDTAEDISAEVINSTKSFVSWVEAQMTWANMFKVIGAVIGLLIMWIVYRIIMRGIRKMRNGKLSAQRYMLITKAVNYAFYVIVIMYCLSLFGVNLQAIWGAAGIAGVALGFAAQTSVSNLISGIFVLGEGILKVGDLVTLGGETGIVDSVDLLSVKIHTLNNQLVRVPNSTVINSNLINTSFFDKRRLTISVSVNYDTDMETALEALKTAATRSSKVLADPEPSVWFDSFGEGGIGLTLAVWFKTEDFSAAKNETFIAIKAAFDEAGIGISQNKLYITANPKV